MMARWRSLPPGDRLRMQAFMALMVLGLYGLLVYPFSHKKFADSEQQLHRRRDRLAKRAGVEDIKGGGPTMSALTNQIAQVEKQLQELAGELEKGFAPAHSSEAQQQLMLEISSAAERSGLDLVSVSRKGFAPKGEAAAAPPVDPELGRHLLDLTARARYGQLLDFLQELRGLSFQVSAMNLKLNAQDAKGGPDPANAAGVLSIQMQISL